MSIAFVKLELRFDLKIICKTTMFHHRTAFVVCNRRYIFNLGHVYFNTMIIDHVSQFRCG